MKVNKQAKKLMDKLDFLNKELGTEYKSFDDVDWNLISLRYKLSEDFIREFKDKFNWVYISKYQKLSEDFIREFRYKVDWWYVSRYQKLSENFIRKFNDRVNWSNISSHQQLSADFINEFQRYVVWYDISKYQKLSEDTIREFKDKVFWHYVSKYQNLSEDFIREFQRSVYWECISKYQKLSNEFITEFSDELISSLIDDNWAYRDTEFLKQQVESTCLYECHDDYFIAYKGIRSDRYSNFNFKYKYLPNETYESFCDCSSDENSFGLSVWTENKAKEYCGQLVVRVKVRYEDVGRVVYNGGKIRCRKITILD